jgi:hypothetical protein
MKNTVAILIILTAVFLTAPQALGTEKILQNDDFQGGATDPVSVPELISGEIYAAVFEGDTTDYPLRVKKIQLLMVSNTSHSGNDCGIFFLVIWKGKANPGNADVILDTSTLPEPIPFEIEGSPSMMYELDLDEVGLTDVKIESGAFRIGLMADATECIMAAGNGHFPLLYVDGVIQSGINFLFGSSGIGGNKMWFDAKDVGVSGDFVLRVVTETQTTGPGEDVADSGSDIGKPDMISSDTDEDMASSDGIGKTDMLDDLSQDASTDDSVQPKDTNIQGDGKSMSGGGCSLLKDPTHPTALSLIIILACTLLILHRKIRHR